MPRLISANRLVDGIVVYWTKDSAWSETIVEARAFEGDASFESAFARAKGDEKANIVVDVVSVDVVLSDGEARPTHIREAIRATGPTVRRDHGKQAGQFGSAKIG